MTDGTGANGSTAVPRLRLLLDAAAPFAPVSSVASAVVRPDFNTPSDRPRCWLWTASCSAQRHQGGAAGGGQPRSWVRRRPESRRTNMLKGFIPMGPPQARSNFKDASIWIARRLWRQRPIVN